LVYLVQSCRLEANQCPSRRTFSARSSCRSTAAAGSRATGFLPERYLAEELGVGRSSLRIALSELERRGRIRRHVGQGTFVTHDPGAEVVTTLRISPPPSPADVFELRLMIEPQIAATAAMRATAPEIRRLHQLVDTGEAA
jgi:GntR family transcriptional regulator, uxu operon transcriptional repressor